jgi:imidazoleglycerol-phosphate dehydratase
MAKSTNTAKRSAEITRKTRETQIRLALDLDGAGNASARSGVGFFDHMLDLLARHSLIDLTLDAKGDLEVDAHHTVEDVGIVLGQALEKALGEKRGIYRYGWAIVPMDESLAQVAIDLSGRPAFVFNVKFPRGTIGDFPVELVEEFFKSVATNAKMNLHITVPYGTNNHHISEAIFKATAKALRQAVSPDPRNPGGMPSTKGSLNG